jgi:hypothetical protein
MVAELTALFERLVADLPTGTAVVRVHHSERDGMTTINIEPTNPASADFGVVADEVTLFAGNELSPATCKERFKVLNPAPPDVSNSSPSLSTSTCFISL